MGSRYFFDELLTLQIAADELSLSRSEYRGVPMVELSVKWHVGSKKFSRDVQLELSPHREEEWLFWFHQIRAEIDENRREYGYPNFEPRVDAIQKHPEG